MIDPSDLIDHDAHSHHSSLRERIVEHIFVGEILRLLWCRGVTNIEVLRTEFDAHGYDIALARGGITRYVQFKTGQKRPASVSVARALQEKQSGCVIWITLKPSLDWVLSVGWEM